MNLSDCSKVDIVAQRSSYTVDTPGTVILNIDVPLRSAHGDFIITIPKEIAFQKESVFVNVIGRGDCLLTKLHLQSPGRCAAGHERLVGRGNIEIRPDGGRCLLLRELDLRADNGVDVQIRIEDAIFRVLGSHLVGVTAKLKNEGQVDILRGNLELRAVSTVTDFERVVHQKTILDTTDCFSSLFQWSAVQGADEIHLLRSVDHGQNWEIQAELAPDCAECQANDLKPDLEYWFCMEVIGGRSAGRSNVAKLYSGMYNVRTCGNAPTDGTNAAGKINEAIAYMESLGGGTVLFEGGIFCTTTIYLKSDVWLYIDKSAEIHALRGCDDEEKCWYSDGEFRNDQSHMSVAPYISPDNWMTKQDAGHSYFHNALFFGQRLDNVKIIGNGRISGNGNLTKSNTVMERESGSRADKLISLKLCTNVEIGGLSVGKDLWYSETDRPNEDQPFYLDADGKNDGCGIGNMLRISNAGHFAVLATGVYGIRTHDIYAEKGPLVRDIFDYVGCNDILVFNIYAEGAPDDVVKLGSDCSLGFTRPSGNCIVRNIIGDTACNLFQIGSETADDIRNVCIDNLYVLGSNKAGFSVSVNDGGHVENIHLNCGGSAGRCRHGVQHGHLDIGYLPAAINPHKSIMRRVRTPFFISLSNRGRTIGCEARQMRFTDDIGVLREEMMVTNVNVGTIRNIRLQSVDVKEVYAASQAKSTDEADGLILMVSPEQLQ